MAKKQKPADVQPFRVSHSKLSSFRRCLQRYQWSYVEKYFAPSAKGQVRGTAGHAALAVWHKDYDAEKALDEAQKTYEIEAGVLDDDWLVLQTTLERYFEWSREHDKFTVITSEQEFNLDFEFGNPAENFTLTGFIDGIVKENDTLWLLENKFYKRADNSPLELDAQVSIYMLAAHHLGYNVEGVIYNIVRVAGTKISETEPVIRRRLNRSPEVLSLIMAEVINEVKAIRLLEKGVLPIYRNPTKDCHWDCAYHSACLMMQMDGNEPTTMLERISHTRSSSNGNKKETADAEEG